MGSGTFSLGEVLHRFPVLWAFTRIRVSWFCLWFEGGVHALQESVLISVQVFWIPLHIMKPTTFSDVLESCSPLKSLNVPCGQSLAEC